MNNFPEIKKAVLAALKAAIKHPQTSVIEPYAEDRLVSWFVNYPKVSRPATQKAMSNMLGDLGVIVVSEASRTAHVGSIVRFNIQLARELSFEEADELENEMEAIAMERHK